MDFPEELFYVTYPLKSDFNVEIRKFVFSSSVGPVNALYRDKNGSLEFIDVTDLGKNYFASLEEAQEKRNSFLAEKLKFHQERIDEIISIMNQEETAIKW